MASQSARSQRCTPLCARGSCRLAVCAAPGANPDYPGEVAKALARWSGTGKFVFTSSGGVYAEDDGQYVDEQSTVSDSARAKKLLDCESAVLAKGGSVVRLAGLYSLERGAHNYWLKAGSVDARPDGRDESLLHRLPPLFPRGLRSLRSRKDINP